MKFVSGLPVSLAAEQRAMVGELFIDRQHLSIYNGKRAGGGLLLILTFC